MNVQHPLPDRRFDLDPFRGVVCLCLVGLHLYSGELYPTLSQGLGSTGDWAVLNLRLGVESFFVLAGFMLAHTLRPQPGERASLPLYLIRRCVRLLPPYWIAVLLAAANLWLARFLAGGGKAAPGLGDLAAQLTLSQEIFGVHEAATGFWSLAALEQFYLLWLGVIALVRWLIPNDNAALRAEAWVAGLGGALAPWLFPHVSGAAFALPIWGGFILMGILLYRASVQRVGRWPFLMAIVSALAAGLTTGDLRFARVAVAVTVLAVVAQGVAMPRWLILQPLRWVGVRSYSIYLVHGMIAYRAFSLDPRSERFGGPIMLLLMTLAVSLLAAAFFYRWVETPCVQAARRIDYRQANEFISMRTPNARSDSLPSVGIITRSSRANLGRTV